MHFSSANFIKPEDLAKNQSPNLSFLDGKTIIRAGLIDGNGFRPHEVRECTFMLDYLDGDVQKRVVLAGNDNGTWIAWNGELGKMNERDILAAKLRENLDKWTGSGILEIVKTEDGIIFRGDDKDIFSLCNHELKLAGVNEDVDRMQEKTGDDDPKLNALHVSLFLFAENIAEKH